MNNMIWTMKGECEIQRTIRMLIVQQTKGKSKALGHAIAMPLPWDW